MKNSKKDNSHSFLSHVTAKSSHYDESAASYDVFNEENSSQINSLVQNILQQYHVKTVLDMTCGTGSQVFWLIKHGFNVVGSDINAKMLAIAKDKAQQKKIDVKFIEGDMRIVQVGKFDAVITIFNAIGHLTKPDFELAIENIWNNLNDKGLYIFDIFNLNYLLKGNNITKLTIDWQKRTDNITVRDIQYSIVDQGGVLASYTITYIQSDDNKPQISQHEQTLQIYTAAQLKDMLLQKGFKVVRQCSFDGSDVDDFETDRIITVAQKI